MRTLSRIVTLASILVICSIAASFAQDSKREPSGSITGRVTVGGKPAVRVTVMLSSSDMSQMQKHVARATTDEEGRFTLKSLPAGSYLIVPQAPALVVGFETTSLAQPGKNLTLAEGEEVDGIDFSLVKGGVITGRVIDADGRPLIEQRINLIRVEDRGPRMPPNFNPFMFTTDDRGVYRIFGLAAGKYKVSVGDPTDGSSIRIGFGSGSYPRTFHPDVADEAHALAIEVSPDSEATGIDIKLGRPSKSFAATGRIIDSDTGKPVANLQYGHGSILRDQRMIGGYGWSGTRTNSNGEFRIEGLAPGRYAAFAIPTEQVDFYSEPAVFEITDSDVSAIEIKTRRGSTISGTVVIEGTDNPEILGRISKLELRTSVQTEDLAAPSSMTPIRISPDGSFLITGLRPGKARILFGGLPSEASRGFSLLRIEREGTVLRDGVEIAGGENVSGVRVVIGYGTCILRGQLKVEGGELTPGTRLLVTVTRLGDSSRRSALPDARGRFHVEWLIAGEYEVTVTLMSVSTSGPGAPAPPLIRGNRTLAKQNVSLTNGVETDVTVVVDLAAKEKDGEN